MIKKYNEYIKESLLDKLQGPSGEEILNNTKNKNLADRLYYMIKVDYFDGFVKLLDMLDKKIKYKFIYKGNKKNDLINYILEQTVIFNNFEMFNYLLNRYNITELDDITFRKITVNAQSSDFLEKLINMGFKIKFSDIIFTQSNIELLIKYGANFYENNGEVIKNIIRNDYFNLFTLIQKYDKHFEKNKNYYFILSAIRKAYSILTYLIEHCNIDVNVEKNFAMDYAIKNNIFDLVNILIKYNPIVTDEMINLAKSKGFVDVYSLLYKYKKSGN